MREVPGAECRDPGDRGAEGKSRRGAGPAEPAPVDRLQADAPGLQAERLAAPRPGPAEVAEYDEQQHGVIGVPDAALRRRQDRLAMRERQHGESRGEGERDDEEQVVEEGREAADQPGRRARRGFDIHAGAILLSQCLSCWASRCSIASLLPRRIWRTWAMPGRPAMRAIASGSSCHSRPHDSRRAASLTTAVTVVSL